MSSNTQGSDHPVSQREKDSINSQCFGDKIKGKKKKEVMRVMFQNIRGLGYTKKSLKSEAVKKTIVDNKVDVMLMTEINVNWERAGRRNSFQNIGRHWFKTCKPSCTFNHHQKIIDNKTKWQPGGHAIVSRDEISRRVHKYDHNNRQIGRWTSQLIKGKENLNTRVVSVYVPRPSKDYTRQRIFCQQQTALLKLGVSGTVLTIFWSDFWAQIDKWLEEGNSLIIGGDWNTDIRNKEFLKPFEERNLIPAVHSKHGYNLPATHNAGSLPIDEIFLSSTIELKNSGYLEHSHSSGDHRPVWVDVTKTDHWRQIAANHNIPSKKVEVHRSKSSR